MKSPEARACSPDTDFRAPKGEAARSLVDSGFSGSANLR